MTLASNDQRTIYKGEAFMMLRIVFFVMAIGFWGTSGVLAELTPKEILTRADEARGNLGGVQWKVDIHTMENGEEQDRGIGVVAKGYDFLGTMLTPPKVKGQKFLMVEHNMWFTKPGVKKPVPISPRQKLVGGASYGDIAATNYSDDYEATPLADDVVNGESCYVFDLKALSKKVTYDRIKYWVAKDRLVGLKAEYYSVSGMLLKTASFEYLNSVTLRNAKQPFISKMVIQDSLVADKVTTLTFGDPKLQDVPASTFDLNLLGIM